MSNITKPSNELYKFSEEIPLFKEMTQKLINNSKKISIVFTEGNDYRIILAAYKLITEKVLHPILLGNENEIKSETNKLHVDSSLFSIIDPKNNHYLKDMIPIFVKKRKGKVDASQAEKILKDVNYFGTMLVEMDIAQGLVSGAVHTTAETVRPGLQIIKPKPGVKKISGAFILIKGDEKYIFSDCAININPSAEELAEIALQSEETARYFGIEPKIAMLSFSSHGSANSEETEKVRKAVSIVREKKPNILIDGEIQFDAAISSEVCKQKTPNSSLQGNATVFVFPTIDAGNIGYKIAQRLGNFSAVGPILQGLAKPVNDLSRGCNVKDVYRLAIISAIQSL